MRTLVFFSFFALVACSKGQPTIESASAVSRLNLSTSVFATKNPSILTLGLQGSCPDFIQSFQVSGDGNSWVTPESLGGSSVNSCASSGTFTVTIPAVGSTFPSIGALPQGSSGTLFVRGMTEFGPTEQASFQITHLTGGYVIRGKVSGMGSVESGTLTSSYQSVSLNAEHDDLDALGYKIRGGLKR